MLVVSLARCRCGSVAVINVAWPLRPSVLRRRYNLTLTPLHHLFEFVKRANAISVPFPRSLTLHQAIMIKILQWPFFSGAKIWVM